MKTKKETITYEKVVHYKNVLEGITQLPFEQIKDIQDKNEYLFHIRFVKAINENKNVLQPHFDTIVELEKPSEDFEKYAKERNEFLAVLAKKDEDGNPVQNKRFNSKGKVIGISYDVPGLGDPKSMNAKKLEKFDKDNKEIQDANEKKQKELKDVLQDTVEVEFVLIKESLIPKGLPSEVLSVLVDFIEWEETEEIIDDKNEEKKKSVKK